jgi:hypothetical protein
LAGANRFELVAAAQLAVAEASLVADGDSVSSTSIDGPAEWLF